MPNGACFFAAVSLKGTKNLRNNFGEIWWLPFFNHRVDNPEQVGICTLHKNTPFVPLTRVNGADCLFFGFFKHKFLFFWPRNIISHETKHRTRPHLSPGSNDYPARNSSLENAPEAIGDL